MLCDTAPSRAARATQIDTEGVEVVWNLVSGNAIELVEGLKLVCEPRMGLKSIVRAIGAGVSRGSTGSWRVAGAMPVLAIIPVLFDIEEQAF